MTLSYREYEYSVVEERGLHESYFSMLSKLSKVPNMLSQFDILYTSVIAYRPPLFQLLRIFDNTFNPVSTQTIWSIAASWLFSPSLSLLPQVLHIVLRIDRYMHTPADTALGRQYAAYRSILSSSALELH